VNRLSLVFVLLAGCDCSWPDRARERRPDAGTPADCEVDPDRDDDGFDAADCGGDDCNDLDAAIHPGAPETAIEGWTTETIYSAGYDGAIVEIAAAGSEDGSAHVAFVDDDSGGWYYGGSIQYASRSAAGSWESIPVDDAYSKYASAAISRISIAARAGTEPLLTWIAAWDSGDFEASYELQTARGGLDGWDYASVAPSVESARTSSAIAPDGVGHLVYSDGPIRHAVEQGGAWATDAVGLGSSPAVAVAEDGEVVVAYLVSGAGGFDVEVARSRPEGWTVTTIATTDDRAEVGVPLLGVDAAGVAHVVLSDDRGIWHVDDRAGDRAEPDVIDPLGRGGQGAVDRGGRFHVAYTRSGGGLFYAKGRDGEWTSESVSAESSLGALAVEADGWVTIATTGAECGYYFDYGGGCKYFTDTVVVFSNRPVPDGTDSDCDGIDSVPTCPDADGDGQRAIDCAGTDCDDARADIFLGADDPLGDGVDQDCDGADGVDRDGDGSLSPQDCDDRDAAIHPGAEEIDDCVDQDCDGRGIPDDDADGHDRPSCGGDDCDDAAPETYPDALDTVGDGVDQDCDGADGVDADGDGWPSVASGGTDCNDASTSTYPDAADGPRVWRKVSADTSGDPSSPSLVIDSAGVLHAGWYRASDGNVRHGRRAPDAGWTTGTVDDVGDGDPDPAIAMGPGDGPYFAYRENVADELRWATNESGAWVHEAVDSAGTPGMKNAMAVEADGTVHVAYVDAWDRDTLEHAWRAGGVWTLETIDAAGATGHDVAIALDADGAVHAVYAELGDEDLRYATNASGAWSVETIDAGVLRAHYASIAIAPDGALHVAYRVGNHGIDVAADLWYATNESGAWVPEVVSNTRDSARGTGIAIDADGVIDLADVADGDLRWTTGAAGAWDSEIVAAGSYDEVALVLDRSGFVHLLSIETSRDDVDEWTDDVLPDGIDQNCDGVDGVDADGDGHASIESGGDDCDDADAAVGACA
jgi:hypothetical protein